MNLFRSEEHVERWLAGREPGATIPVTTLADLTVAWGHDRLAPDWRPPTRAQNQAIRDGLGLTGRFWELPRRSMRQSHVEAVPRRPRRAPKAAE
jgi:hypothetical protein